MYARWKSHTNRASNAKYTINHAGGSTVVTVNQQAGGGQFNLLGTFDFAPGTATITLSDDAGGSLIADAVKIVDVNAAPNTATWAMLAGGSTVLTVNQQFNRRYQGQCNFS